MTRSPPKDPLIAVIGSTGTGKSQLAVELAKRYNGEVINSDAMQLYAGLPIITNKITVEEQQGVPHHLLGCIGLDEQTWVVGIFVKKALVVINEIRSRGRLPILVGGSHYYTQSLLFEDRLVNESRDQRGTFVADTKKKWPVLQQSNEVLLEELRRVDPVMADRWHPNDRRKIQRSLEIYLQTGRKASEIYAEQHGRSAAKDNVADWKGDDVLLDGPRLRFSTLLFWAHTDKGILRERLDGRVDKMLERGLLQEVHALNNFAQAQPTQGRPVDETRGIFVSIGYKEFKAYSQALDDSVLSEQQLQKLEAEALERTKIATRQYAKQQLRWIRIKLITALSKADSSRNLYILDGSDLSSFGHDVVTSALDLASQFLTAKPMPEPTSICDAAAGMLTSRKDYDIAATPEKWMKQHCESCGVTCVTEEQWAMHLKGKAHRKLRRKRKKTHGQSGASESRESKEWRDP